MKKIEERQGEFAKILTEQRKCLEIYPEPENWTPEQAETMRKMDEDLNRLEKEINDLKQREATVANMKSREERTTEKRAVDLRENPQAVPLKEEIQKRQVDAFMHVMKHGFGSLPIEQRAHLVSEDISLGYLVTPEVIAAGILQNVDDMVYMRQLATKETLTTAVSLGVITLNSDTDDYEWSTEIGNVTEGADVEVGKREFIPHPARKLMKISRQLLRQSTRAESLVQERCAYRKAMTEEYAFMLGDGDKKPLGIFVASPDGIPTSRDVSTDNTATQIKPDNLISIQGSLKEQYRRNNPRWCMHRDSLTMIRKFKGGDGQYIMQPGFDAVGPTILGDPYFLSEMAPNTYTTGKYWCVYGDFSRYWIVDSLQMQIQILNELYALNRMVGYIFEFETDGQPAIAEAFVRGQMA